MAEAEVKDEVEEHGEEIGKEELSEVAEEEADAYTFDNRIHEQLYNGYQMYHNGHFEDEEAI